MVNIQFPIAEAGRVHVSTLKSKDVQCPRVFTVRMGPVNRAILVFMALH